MKKLKMFPRAKIKLPKCANSIFFNMVFCFSNYVTIFKLVGHFCPWLDRFQDPFQKFGRHQKFIFRVDNDSHVMKTAENLARGRHWNILPLVKIWQNSIIIQDWAIENDFWQRVSSKLLEGIVFIWFYSPECFNNIGCLLWLKNM